MASNPKSTLVLVPTEMELSLLNEFMPALCESNRFESAVCGFGPVASGINAACLLTESKGKFQRVVLLGIAGSYDLNRFPVGSAISDFSDVACDGVGAGTSDEMLLPSALGFPICQVAGQPIFERVPLETHDRGDSQSIEGQQTLLTVCRSADGQADVNRRMERFPTAVAEDMEGFSVALAARRLSIPVTIIRGISNLAGDREKSNWQIRPAIQAAAERLAAN